MNERLAFRTGLLRQLLVASAVASAACGDSGSGSGAGGSGGGGETASGGGGETASGGGGETASGGGGAAAGGQGGEGGQGAAGGGNAGGQGGMAGAGGSSGSGMNGVERCFFGVPPCPPAAEAVTVFGSCTDQLELVTEWISGPTEVNGTCCYQVNVTAPNAGECAAIGRPFMVENQARVAPLRVGDRRWEAAGLAPDLSSLSPELRAQLGREWAHDAAYEHASIASFGKLALELLVFGAPADLIERTHRAAADEIRHAQAGFALASSYLGQPVGPSTLPEAARLVLAGSLEELAAAAVREGCCGETLAALVADAQRDAATDPVVREVLTRIAAEEAEHAALAYSVVAWAIATGGDSVRTAAHRAFIESTHDLEQACANAEQSEALSHNEALRAHGRLSAKEALRERLRGMREVVAPAMAQLLGEAS